MAEELGIERSDIVEKAASVGVTLKSPMASVDEESAALMRTKLSTKKTRDLVTERRVRTSSGAAVIRRRKKVAPEPRSANPWGVGHRIRSSTPSLRPTRIHASRIRLLR